MRLEIEPTLSAPHLTKDHSGDNHETESAEARSALNQGIKAARAGNRAQARTSLLRATEIDPRNENAWLWLASISEYPEELLGFLNHVLEVNPENERALEWKAATHALLSRTFVQRGIDASQESQTEFAAECFQTALEYDDRNAAAWMWMASLSDSNTVKVGLLEKALAVEPDNQSAHAAITVAKANILKERLAEAKTAAVAGNNAEAISVLDALLTTNSDAVEAWMMRSHLADGFDEKIRCFENILAIDPENVAARAGRDSLLAIFGTAKTANAEQTCEVAAVDETSADGFESEPAYITAEPMIEKSPTEELEMPSAFLNETPAQTNPENEYENEGVEGGAEPFGSLAEETAEPAEAECEPERVTPEDESTDQSFTPQEESTGEAYADPQAETVVFTCDAEPVVETAFDRELDQPSDPEIPVPIDELPVIAPQELVMEHPGDVEVVDAEPEYSGCPFCGQANDPQAISCQMCMAVLTLSDLELLLANHSADQMILRPAVEEMERQRLAREFNSQDLVTLGLGHLNLRNLHLGYSCLLEASKLDTNNVVLIGQVNALLIRLDEIKQQEEAHLKMPKGKSILVVDDSPTVLKLIAGKLEKCGHEVICANDGVEAMERLEHFIPDLVLLDINMPRMDGYQVCKTIRSNNSTKDVPVVMISGKDGFFDKVRGRMAGTTGYITKPFGPETLMKAVEIYLSGEIPESDEV